MWQPAGKYSTLNLVIFLRNTNTTQPRNSKKIHEPELTISNQPTSYLTYLLPVLRCKNISITDLILFPPRSHQVPSHASFFRNAAACQYVALTMLNCPSKDVERGEVLIFKEVSWQTVRIEAKSTVSQDLTPLRYYYNIWASVCACRTQSFDRQMAGRSPLSELTEFKRITTFKEKAQYFINTLLVPNPVRSSQ